MSVEGQATIAAKTCSIASWVPKGIAADYNVQSLCFIVLQTMDEESMETEDAPSQGASTVTPDHLVLFLSASPNVPTVSSPPPPMSETPGSKGLGESLYVSPHSQQVSMAEYNAQCTQQALRDLKASPEYKKHTMKCCRSA